MADNRNWSLIGGLTIDKLLEWLEIYLRFYKAAFSLSVVAAIVLTLLMVVLNMFGMKGGCFWVILPALIAWGFFTFHPYALLPVFGFGALEGLSNFRFEDLIKHLDTPGVQLREDIQSGWASIKKYAWWFSQVPLFLILMASILGLKNLEDANMALAIIEILVGIGFWVLLFSKEPKWYKRASITILIFAGVVALVKGFTNFDLDNVGYTKTVEVEIDSYKDKEVCGLPAGMKVKYKIPKRVDVRVNGTDRILTNDIRINSTVPEEEVSINRKGCVTMTYSTPRAFRETAVVEAQMVSVTFYRS